MDVLERRRRIARHADRLTERSATWYASLSDDEIEAVKDWQLGISPLLNEALRVDASARRNGETGLFSQTISENKRLYLEQMYANLMSAAEKSVESTPLQAPLRLFRGVRDKYRYLEAIAKSRCVVTFESWTLDPYVARDFAAWTSAPAPAIVEVIVCPRYPFIWVPPFGGAMSGQYEVLLPPGPRELEAQGGDKLDLTSEERAESRELARFSLAELRFE